MAGVAAVCPPTPPHPPPHQFLELLGMVDEQAAHGEAAHAVADHVHALARRGADVSQPAQQVLRMCRVGLPKIVAKAPQVLAHGVALGALLAGGEGGAAVWIGAGGA